MKNLKKQIPFLILIMIFFVAGCKNPFPQNPEDYTVELKKTGNFDYINVYFKLNEDFVPVYEKYGDHITYGAQVNSETEKVYQQNVQCEVLNLNTKDSKCTITILNMTPFSEDEELEITISLTINQNKCGDFMAEAGANICTATTPHLITSGDKVVDVSTAGQDVSDDKVYQDDSPLLSGDYGTICADDPTDGTCDMDKDGVINRLDPCPEDAEPMKEGGKEPMDGVYDGCPNSKSAGQAGKQSPYSQNPSGQGGDSNSGWLPGGDYSSGESACTFIEGIQLAPIGLLWSFVYIVMMAVGYLLASVRVRSNKEKHGAEFGGNDEE